MIENKATIHDLYKIVRLARELWPHHTTEELVIEFSGVLDRDDAAIFFADLDGEAVGFAQCQLRHDYVEGTSTSPVGIWREYLCLHPTARKVLLASCSLPVKTGQRSKVAANLLATASCQTTKA